MTKKEMALIICEALFGKPVSEDNWKVKDLMKRTKVDLEDMLEKAHHVINKTGDFYESLKEDSWTKRWKHVHNKNPHFLGCSSYHLPVRITVYDYTDAIHGGKIPVDAKDIKKYEVDAWCLQGETGFRAFFYLDDLFCEAHGDDGHWWLVNRMHYHWVKEFKEVVHSIELKED